MANLFYTVTAEGSDGPVSASGAVSAVWEEKGDFRSMILKVKPELPACTLTDVRAELPIRVAEDEFIFMNGFQAWSYSPELSVKDKMRGINGLPKPLVNYFGLDRYGDYFYRDYPNRSGITQGVSYCYFRDGERFRLIGSLDEAPGYTEFRYFAKLNKLEIVRDCAGVKAEGSYPAFELYLAEGTEKEVFDGWFAAMGIAPCGAGPIFGYTSWYNRYENIFEECILNDLAGAAKVLKPGDLFQIDDGWEPAVGDWLEADPKKFPQGMKVLADQIHEKGFKAGLWLAPFVACRSSKLYQEHPQWFYFHESQPWYCGINWGGFYALDFDYPEVREYLKETFRKVFDEWGYDLVKLDFLYAAAPFGSEKESRGGRMIRAMKFLRELCGDKLIIGCGVPLMPAFGLVDYCRISCDVSLDWNDVPLHRIINRERISTRQAIHNAIFRRQLDGRAFGNDPDVFYLRDDNLKLSAEQKKLLAINCALFGTVHFCSDDMNDFNDIRKDAMERLREISRAQDIKVEHEKGEKETVFRVSYSLDGKTYTYDVPWK